MSVLTGTQVLLLVVSETGLVYTFTTPKLQPLVTKAEGKNLIQVRRSPAVARILAPRARRLTHTAGLSQCSRSTRRQREWSG